MNNTTANKTIGSLSIIGLATILLVIVAVTITWVDPFLSTDQSGRTMFFGKMLLFGIYAVEIVVPIAFVWQLGSKVRKMSRNKPRMRSESLEVNTMRILQP